MAIPSDGATGSASALSSVFTLLNSAVGAGVLSLPYAFFAAGWAGCLIAIFAVAAIEGFTLFVLARYAEVTGSKTYSDLVRKMLGRKASAAMSVVVIIYCYGSATAYLIILGDCFQPLLALAYGEVWWTQRDLVILVAASAFMLPLCFPKTLNAISGFSSVTFYALLVVVASVVRRSFQAIQAPAYDWEQLAAFTPLRDALNALPILAFGFQCHTNLVAVFHELEDEPELFPTSSPFPSVGSLTNLLGAGDGAEAAADSTATADGGDTTNSGGGAAAGEAEEPQRVMLLRNPQRRFVTPVQRTAKLLGMVQVVVAAIFITATFYSLVGLFGYLNFPTNAHSNILLNYPISDRLMQVARVLVAVIQIIHYPVNHFPARNATRDLLRQLTGRAQLFPGFNTAEVLFFFVATLGLSLAVTDLGQVFKLIGGSCGAFFIFGVPGALLLQYAYNKHIHLREGLLEEPLLAGEDGIDTNGGGRHSGHSVPALPAAAPGVHPAGAQQPGGQQQLPGVEQQAGRGHGRDYHFLLSKLWWAGVFLILLGVGLLFLTIYTLVAPPLL